MVTQQQFEKALGVVEQDHVMQLIPGNFSEETFNKYFESENGLFDWVVDEVKNVK